jgi:hypothetical protein
VPGDEKNVHLPVVVEVGRDEAEYAALELGRDVHADERRGRERVVLLVPAHDLEVGVVWGNPEQVRVPAGSTRAV